MATDYEDLKRILADVVALDTDLHPSMLTTTFDNGVRLSFGCGDDGRLNMVVIQDALRKSTEVVFDGERSFSNGEWSRGRGERSFSNGEWHDPAAGRQGQGSLASSSSRASVLAPEPSP